MTHEACGPRLHAMNEQTAPVVIDDIYTLVLVDGLPAESGGKTLKYRTVKLRETTVADERAAARLAENSAKESHAGHAHMHRGPHISPLRD